MNTKIVAVTDILPSAEVRERKGTLGGPLLRLSRPQPKKSAASQVQPARSIDLSSKNPNGPKELDRFKKYGKIFSDGNSSDFGNSLVQSTLEILATDKGNIISYHEYRNALLSIIREKSLQKLMQPLAFSKGVLKLKSGPVFGLIQWTKHLMSLFEDENTHQLISDLERYTTARSTTAYKLLGINTIKNLPLKELQNIKGFNPNDRPDYAKRQEILQRLTQFSSDFSDLTDQTFEINGSFEKWVKDAILEDSQDLVNPTAPVSGIEVLTSTTAGYMGIKATDLKAVVQNIHILIDKFPELIQTIMLPKKEFEQECHPDDVELLKLANHCRLCLLLNAQPFERAKYPMWGQRTIGNGPTFVLSPSDQVNKIELKWRPEVGLKSHTLTIYTHIVTTGSKVSTRMSLSPNPDDQEHSWDSFDTLYQEIKTIIDSKNHTKWIELQLTQLPQTNPSYSIMPDGKIELHNESTSCPYQIRLDRSKQLEVVDTSHRRCGGPFESLREIQEWIEKEIFPSDKSKEFRENFNEYIKKKIPWITLKPGTQAKFQAKIAGKSVDIDIRPNEVVLVASAGLAPLRQVTFATPSDLLGEVEFQNATGETTLLKCTALIKTGRFAAIEYICREVGDVSRNHILTETIKRLEGVKSLHPEEIHDLLRMMISTCNHPLPTDPPLPTKTWIHLIRKLIGVFREKLGSIDQPLVAKCLDKLAACADTEEINTFSPERKMALLKEIVEFSLKTSPELGTGLFGIIAVVAEGNTVYDITLAIEVALKSCGTPPHNPKALADLIRYFFQDPLELLNVKQLYHLIVDGQFTNLEKLSDVKKHLLIALGANLLSTPEGELPDYLKIDQLTQFALELYEPHAYELFAAKATPHAEEHINFLLRQKDKGNPKALTMLTAVMSIAKKSAQWPELCNQIFDKIITEATLTVTDDELSILRQALEGSRIEIKPEIANRLWALYRNTKTPPQTADKISTFLVKMFKEASSTSFSSELLTNIQTTTFTCIHQSYQDGKDELSEKDNAVYRYLFSKASRLLGATEFTVTPEGSMTRFQFIIMPINGQPTVLQLSNSGKKLPPRQVEALKQGYHFPTYVSDDGSTRSELEFGSTGYCLGVGQYGKVSTAIDVLTNEVMAIKKIHKSKVVSSDIQYKELTHPHLMSPLGNIERRNKKGELTQYIAFPLAKNTLATTLQTQTQSQGRKEIYAHQLLNAVAYLHSKELYHHDLRLDNIGVMDEGVRIIDFGCMGTTETCSFTGTKLFFPPDMFIQSVKKKKAQTKTEFDSQSKDSYALGLILAALDLNRTDLNCLHFDQTAREAVEKVQKTPVSPQIRWDERSTADYTGSIKTGSIRSKGSERTGSISVSEEIFSMGRSEEDDAGQQVERINLSQHRGEKSPLRWALCQLIHHRKKLTDIIDEYNSRFKQYQEQQKASDEKAQGRGRAPTAEMVERRRRIRDAMALTKLGKSFDQPKDEED